VTPRRKSTAARKPAAARRPAASRTLSQRIAAVPHSPFFDRLLTGRAWIVLVAGLLAGIVFANVALLEMNSGIARTTEKVAELKRENARLRLQAARLGSTERIQRAAADLGLVLPAPGEVRYLRARPGHDAELALKRMTAPDAVPVVAPVPVAPVTEPVAAETTTPPPTDPAAAAPTDPAAVPTEPATVPPATAAPAPETAVAPPTTTGATG
jgi:cell division protein FtsL